MKITVIGTGYVGLVTGSCFAYMGNLVTCIDIDKKKISDLNKGIIRIFEPGLDRIVKKGVKNNCLHFTTNFKDSIRKSDIVFIAVGTPPNEDGSSNLSFVYKVAEDIGKYIDKDKIIITKSTIPVGTTYKVKEIIEKEISKRNENIEFSICNNPEFLKEGKAVNDFMSPDRIIIGFENDNDKNIIKNLYNPFSINHEKLIFMDILSSELTKYAANAMLATKISFMNEMSIIAEEMNADINKVRQGIGSDSRIGYSFIYPSVGYGGSCFPKDVRSIIDTSNKKGFKPQILTAVDKVNNNQKKYFFNKLFEKFKNKEGLLKGFQFGIWGLAFKPGTDDMRESASIYFVEQIIKLGGTVYVYDPKAMNNARSIYFKDLKNINYCSDKMDVLNGSDALILLTEWPEFRSPDFTEIKSKLKTPVFFDGRNQFDKDDMKSIGIEYHQVGVKSIQDI
tara:strand:- start:2556 stop:3905 length:1350 start_codon:yes stop_codon:yes gene_type:complete